MKIYIIEDYRFPFLEKHKGILSKYFAEIIVYHFSKDYSIIHNQSETEAIPNEAGDWTFYLHIMKNVSSNDDTAFANTTFLYKHPFRFILSKMNVNDAECINPIFYGVSRRYRNGLTHSPKYHFLIFFSSFFFVLNGNALRLMQSDFLAILIKVVSNKKFREHCCPPLLLKYAFSHAYNHHSSYGHAVSRENNPHAKLHKYHAVICEHIFSEWVQKNLLIECCNITVIDSLLYSLNQKIFKS